MPDDEERIAQIARALVFAHKMAAPGIAEAVSRVHRARGDDRAAEYWEHVAEHAKEILARDDARDDIQC